MKLSRCENVIVENFSKPLNEVEGRNVLGYIYTDGIIRKYDGG